MIYVEDTITVEKIAQKDDQLLILDGTTCLDYLGENAVINEKSWIQSLLDSLRAFVKNLL
jgi:hypothetical protein